MLDTSCVFQRQKRQHRQASRSLAVCAALEERGPVWQCTAAETPQPSTTGASPAPPMRHADWTQESKTKFKRTSNPVNLGAEGRDIGSFTEAEEEITARPKAISAERMEHLLLALFNSPPERAAVRCGVRMDLEEGKCKERAKAEETRSTSVFHSPPLPRTFSPVPLTRQSPLAMLPFHGST
ncbi:hypothetical protein ROHU_004125 [Labeo rohita]|uniref:Uncharacterized protein n=1 Tax=Labeo rohita TaxID=84645 RepID=A0A498NRB9_LABRO|nr:hypothetical protein ROHU_004125 [Labeo rohita]